MTARLTIGDFSMMSRLSRKTLRHYHEVGLLEPAHVDPFTGYRHYDTGQVRVAQIIRRFRELGMPVPEVKAFLASDDRERRDGIIAAHLRRMEERLRETRETVGALRELIDPARQPVDVVFRTEPATPVWAVTETVRLDEVTTWFHDALREIRSRLATDGGRAHGPAGGVYATELFSEEAGEATVFIPTSCAAPTAGRVRALDLPPAEFAVAVHTGDHRGIDRTYGALGSYVAERLLNVDGPVREYYLPVDEADGEARTEICWPVLRTAGA